MSRRLIVSVLLMPLSTASAQMFSAPHTIGQPTEVLVNTACTSIAVGLNSSLNGFVPSPGDAWHQDISVSPVDPMSNTIMVSNVADLAGYHLHPDFGTQYGIPYNVVDTEQLLASPQYAQQKVPMTVYPGDSDLTYYPVLPGLAVEGNPGQCPNDSNDRHLLILDRYSCTAYEMYQAALCNGSWTASNGLLFDMLTTEQRPYGLGSADASGLSVFEGLVRYDEILAGSINHAIRFTAPNTKADGNHGYFEAPATHAAGNLYGTDNIMGMRIRLKASYDISGFSQANQIILTAMKKYGMILADNGSKLYFQGTTDSRWNDSDLSKLSNVPSEAFEVVQMPTAYDSQTAPIGAAPVITSFIATPSNRPGAAYYLLTANVTGASYSYMDSPGYGTGAIFRGTLLVQPAQTTTYTLTSRNLYGTTQATVTISIANSRNKIAPRHPETGLAHWR